MLAERRVPDQAVGQPAKFILGVGRVNIDQREVGKLHGEHPPFPVVILDAEPFLHRQRFFTGEHGHPGVTGFFRRTPETVVAAEFQWQLHLFRAGLGFLKAEDVRPFGGHEIPETLAQHGADAIDVP